MEEFKGTTLSIRVHNTTKKSAAFAKNWFEHRLKYPFSYAISTRNFLWLDFDCRGEKERCLEVVKEVAKFYSERYGGEYDIYETPHGYHLVGKQFVMWQE